MIYFLPRPLRCYVISSGGTWLPGCYQTMRAARYAFQFPYAVLAQIQKSRYGLNIRSEDLIAWKRLRARGASISVLGSTGSKRAGG